MKLHKNKIIGCLVSVVYLSFSNIWAQSAFIVYINNLGAVVRKEFDNQCNKKENETIINAPETQIIVNQNSDGYFITKCIGNCKDASYSYHSFSNEIKYFPSDEMFLSFWDYHLKTRGFNLNFFINSNSNYKCSYRYCVAYNLEGLNELILYEGDEMNKVNLYSFSDQNSGPLKIEYFKNKYLFFLRSSSGLQEVNLYVFDLANRKLVHTYAMSNLIDIKVLNERVLLLVSEQKINTSNDTECYSYEIIDNKFKILKIENFDKSIRWIY